MPATTFDTHKFVRHLKDAGFEEKQAEPETATRHDLKELELPLKTDEQMLRGEMHAMEYRMTIKLGGMIAASVAVIAALVKLF